MRAKLAEWLLAHGHTQKAHVQADSHLGVLLLATRSRAIMRREMAASGEVLARLHTTLMPLLLQV